METRRCVLRGRVQGVGFRWYVVRSARELGVRGTVRNRPDGTVEAVLQAEDAEKLDAMIGHLREGPGAARVEDVKIEWVEPEVEYGEMRVIG